MNKKRLREFFLQKMDVFIPQKERRRKPFPRKWLRRTFSWREDFSYLKNTFDFFRKNARNMPELMASLERQKQPCHRWVKSFFYLFVLLGTATFAAALFCILKGKFDTAFCFHAAFMILAALFLLFLFKGIKS